MDTLPEIRRKMDSGNPILIATATDNLINIIKAKIKGTRTDMTNITEMLLLQEYCFHRNPIICTTALRGLCAFMATNNYQNQVLIDWLVVLNPQIKCKTGFIQEIFLLLVCWLENDETVYNEYINTLVDLLIKIMDESLDEWPAILIHMKINTNFDNVRFINNWLNVTKPLFKFIFLSRKPYHHRITFVKLFVEILCCAADYDVLFEIYSWLQITNLEDTLFVYNFLEEFCDQIPDTLHEIKFNLCLCIIQTSVQFISYGYDPTLVLQRLNSLLFICPCASNISLLCVSKTLSVCSSKFVVDILNFCSKVIQNYGCYEIIAQTLVASCLQWNRAKVIDDETMNLFLSTINSDLVVTKSCSQNHNLLPYLTTDSFLITSYSLVKICPEFNDEQFISKWLSEIDQVSDLLNDSEFNFYLAGLYLSKMGNRSQKQIILKLLNKQFLIPIISYAVNIETSYYNRFDLIRLIPTAACVQDNLSLIISFIKRFENSNEETLNILSIDMYYDLWMTEIRCYRFLLYCLSKDKTGWQWNVVKSYTIQKIVKSNPNSDLVTVLKRMLGFYIKRSMYLPMKLTLQSLVDLCISEYIKPEALLKIINENICDIHHPSVISSYCDLLAVSANQMTENEKRHVFLKKLWSMVLDSNDDTVKCALRSLSNIDLDSMPLHVLPEKFQCFPKIRTQLEDLEKVDLLNSPIPGECWVKFLQYFNKTCINEAQSVLSVWLRQELKNNVVSRAQSDHEPKNLKHLSDHSIARGLMSFVIPKRKKIIDTDEDSKVACLAVINSADHPMYPLDWIFLEKYLIEGPQNKLWKESVTLIANQSTRSTSAFRLLHKCYEHRSNLNNHQIKLLFRVLFKVSNIHYHNSQKQFMTDVVNEILSNIINETTYSTIDKDVDLLCDILSECKQILQSPETHMENVNIICNNLENIWCTIHLENKKIVYAFLDCCLALPVEVLNNLRPFPVQEPMLIKFIIICSAQNIVSSNISFDELNECIRACTQFSKGHSFLCDQVIEVFKLNSFVPYHQQFIANFMIYLAGFTKKMNSITEESFCLLCSIFIDLIIILSGYNSITFTNDKKLKWLVFPFALATFSKNTSQSSRVIEWLKIMRTIQHLPEKYSKLFYCCLGAFKNDKCLIEWTSRKQIVLHRSS